MSHPLARWIRSSWVWYLRGEGVGWCRICWEILGFFWFVWWGGWGRFTWCGRLGMGGVVHFEFFEGSQGVGGTCFWFNDCVFDSFKYQWNSGGSSVEDKIVFKTKKTPDELTRLWLLKRVSLYISISPTSWMLSGNAGISGLSAAPKLTTQAPHTRAIWYGWRSKNGKVDDGYCWWKKSCTTWDI